MTTKPNKDTSSQKYQLNQPIKDNLLSLFVIVNNSQKKYGP